MKIASYLIVGIIVIAGLYGVHQIEKKEEKLQLRQIELKDTRIELRKLNKEYRELEQNNDTNEKKLKQLRERKKELEKQVKAKKRRERIARENATRTAQAHATEQVANTTAPNVSTSCEAYRGLLSQYDWNVDIAMFVMEKESGCDPNAVGPTNDHGLFQLNGVPIYNAAENIAYAYHNKYVNSRVGSPRNWSSWYAVCTPGNNPQPIYAGVHCQ